jgi:hypothetical protein
MAKVSDKSTLIDVVRPARHSADVSGVAHGLWMLVEQILDPNAVADFDRSELVKLFLDDNNSELISTLCEMKDVDSLPATVFAVRTIGPHVSPRDEWISDGLVQEAHHRSGRVRRAIDALSADGRPDAAKDLAELVTSLDLAEWHDAIRHAQSQQRRLMRDQTFQHPKAAAAHAALHCGPPVNASDLRAVVTAELRKLHAELRTDDTRPWKQYWNRDDHHGKVTTPLIENECRDHLLLRLRDRLDKYRIAAALPEARRGEETRADMLIMTGAGRNLPVEVKRHFNPDLWLAASTQLQRYAAAPGADGLGIYLVFWFGNDVGGAPTRPDCRTGPLSAGELAEMLIEDLPAELKERTDVLVFDVSNPTATAAGSRRRMRRVCGAANVVAATAAVPKASTNVASNSFLVFDNEQPIVVGLGLCNS